MAPKGHSQVRREEGSLGSFSLDDDRCIPVPLHWVKKQWFKNMAVHTPKTPDEAETVDHRDCQLITCPMIQI